MNEHNPGNERSSYTQYGSTPGGEESPRRVVSSHHPGHHSEQHPQHQSQHPRQARKRKRVVVIFSMVIAMILVAAAMLIIPLLSQLSTTSTTTAHSTTQSSSVTKDSSQKSNSSADTKPKQTPHTSQQTQDSTAGNDGQVKWVKQSTPAKLPILMYHAIHVMDPSEAHNARLIVSPQVFESHLQAMKDAGYYPVTPEEAHKILTQNVVPEGKKPVWLTFDDGIIDFYTQAYPLMKKYGFKGTNFVITGFVEEGRPSNISVAQMLEMKQAGMSFQGHTVYHPDLSKQSAAVQEQQLADSKAFLDKQLSQNTFAVAYPAGRYNEDTLRIGQQTGYTIGLTTHHGVAEASDGLLTLKRVRVNPTTSAAQLLAEMAY